MLHSKHGKQYHRTMVMKTTQASFKHNSVGALEVKCRVEDLL